MVGFCQMMLVWPRSAVLRGAVCLPNPCIQVLLLRANNLGFGAESLRQKISAMVKRGPHGPARCRSVIVVPSAAHFEPVASHLPSFCRYGADERNSLGFIPVHRLNACVKELISRYPRSHAISEIGNSRSLR